MVVVEPITQLRFYFIGAIMGLGIGGAVGLSIDGAVLTEKKVGVDFSRLFL